MPVTAFQPNAFQWDSFQVITRPPDLYVLQVDASIQIGVLSELERHEQGDSIYIRAECKDGSQIPAIRFDPSGGVLITLYNPAGVAVVTAATMTDIGVGLAEYHYQTTGASPVGLWSAVFSATNGGRTGVTLPIGVFVLN